MARSHHRRGWGPCTNMTGKGLWQKSMYLAWFCLSDVNSSIWGLISNTTLRPSGHGKKPPSSRLGTLYNHYTQLFITKIHVLRVVLFVRRQFNHCVLISNTTLGPSGSRTNPPSSRLKTLYSYYRQWFMSEIHMFREFLLVRRQFKRCMSISNTPLGPSGRDLRPPSSKLGTLYSHYRQWVMTHVLRLVSFVQCQFKRCVSIWNTTLGPSGHGIEPPSSRLGNLYSPCSQWFMTEINVLRLVLFIQYQFKCLELVYNTTLGPSGHGTKPSSSRFGTLYSCYRQWFNKNPCIEANCVCPTSIHTVGVQFQTPHWPQ